MNSWQLECFIRVAETMNFRKAASVLHLTQPALTKQIKSLESALGAKLFERDTTHVALTDDGARFLERAIELHRLMESTMTMFQGSRRVVFNYFYGYGLPQVVRRFRKERPQTILQLLRLKMWGLTENVVKRPDNVVLGRQSDLAAIPGIVFAPLMEAEEYVVVSAENPLARLESIRHDQLRGQTVIRSGSSLSSRDISIEGARNEDRLEQCSFIGCDNLTEAITMVQNDCGIAFFLLPEDIEMPGIVRIPVVDPFVDVLGVGYLEKNATDDVRLLARILVDVYSDESLSKVLL